MDAMIFEYMSAIQSFLDSGRKRRAPVNQLSEFWVVWLLSTLDMWWGMEEKCPEWVWKDLYDFEEEEMPSDGRFALTMAAKFQENSAIWLFCEKYAHSKR